MTMAPMQHASGAIISHRSGTETSNPADRAPSALSAVDGMVKARIIAAVAGIAAPLSVTSAPCSAPCQAIVGAEPETSSTEPHRRELSVPPQYFPLGRYGNRLERVEAVSRFAGSCGGWNVIETKNFEYGDERPPEPDSFLNATAQPVEPDRDLAVIVDTDARNECDIYGQLVSWLRTHRQDTALRELTQLRRVLVLIPTDKLGQSWQAYLMCPASATNVVAMYPPGAKGRSWPLHAQGTFVFAELAARWPQWRMHQHLRADGVWQLEQSSEGPRAPACGDSTPQLLPSVCNGIPLHLTEPRRLRRLLGTQWTLLMLLAPEPLPLAPRRRV